MTQKVFSDLLREAHQAVAAGGRVALCQIVRTEGSTPGKAGWKLLVRPGGEALGNLGGGAFEALVRDDALHLLAAESPVPAVKRYYFTEDAVRGEATGMVCGGLAEVFLEVLAPPPLLAICGGGPVGQALAAAGSLGGFDLMVAEDRDEFTRAELFPPGTLVERVDRSYSRDFLAGHSHRDLYVAIVTRCWETDLAALAALLRQAPPVLRYLGLMGSHRKIERVRSEVEKQGHSLEGVPFTAPIGLPLGGSSPGEIAIAILAEIIQQRRSAPAAAKPGPRRLRRG
ncbi:MAG TPA: XdhC/CoxI family protein [Thermoanaerobaculia bacterium]|nr:XdhC/CoxI family protein [Thermoanaerobaculia bacterium]